MRFMSPSTRIIGGTPAERCRSEALFLTANASSWAISRAIESSLTDVPRQYSRSRSIRLPYVKQSAEFSLRSRCPTTALAHRLARSCAQRIAAAAAAAGRDVRLRHASGGEQGAAGGAAARRAGAARPRRTSARTTCRRRCRRSTRSPALAPTWHFIGRLQANKTRAGGRALLLGAQRRSLRIAERLSAQRPHARAAAECLRAGATSPHDASKARRRAGAQAPALLRSCGGAAAAAPARPDVHAALRPAECRRSARHFAALRALLRCGQCATAPGSTHCRWA